MRTPTDLRLYLALFTGLLLACIEPACAGNKFEIIGGGVSGSSSIKRAHIELLLYGVGGVFLLSALLAVAIPHRNPLLLNYANWRQSAVLFVIIGVLALIGAVLLG
jgi:hypothetical protein